MKNFRKTVLLALVFVAISVLSISVWQITSAQTKPLTYPEIITALNTKVPNKSFKTKPELINWVIVQIRQRKVDKPLTLDYEELLRQAGATDELIGTIYLNSPSSSLTTPTPAKTPAVTMDKNFKNPVGMEFVRIPSGTFMMGTPEKESSTFSKLEKPHKVTISRDFYMGKYEVTLRQWKALMGNNPLSEYSECKADNCPISYVSWRDAQAFIKKLNAKNEGTYRLPTEAEWEYAARAGTTTPFAVGNGNKLSSDDANFDGTSGGVSNMDFLETSNFLNKPVRVGSYEPNAWGLYDMHGNVAELCADFYEVDYYSNSPGVDPAGPPSGNSRVARGGSYLSGAFHLRSASRGYSMPNDQTGAIGFRLVRE